MAKSASITRRAAIVGAIASTAALAVPVVAKTSELDGAAELLGIVDGLPPDARNELLVKARLSALIRKFIDDAKAIDPTIKSAWIGSDMLVKHRGAICSVVFDRRDMPPRKRTA